MEQYEVPDARQAEPGIDLAGSVLICLLGPFQILSRDEPVIVHGNKAEALLRMLALRQGDTVERHEILAALWPERERLLATQSLNSLVYGIQRSLRGALGGASTILNDDRGYRLNLGPGLDIDVIRFDLLVSAGHRLVRVGDLDGARRVFADAVRLYRGDLRVGSSIQDIIERERLRASYFAALAHLADYHFVRTDYTACLEYALRILAADPCREDAHRLVMRCRVRRNERAQALRQYRICEDVLRAEFDAAPEPATRAIYDQIRLNPASI